MAEGQTVALDMLFAPRAAMLAEPAPEWSEIQANAHRLVSRKSAAFVGYCRIDIARAANNTDLVPHRLQRSGSPPPSASTRRCYTNVACPPLPGCEGISPVGIIRRETEAMLRKLFETFTATHFTVLAVTAILAPSALYATVATTAVSITDPNLGSKSLVDNGRRLWVYDAIAGYHNNPLYFVRIETTCSSSTSGTLIYTAPTGQALIITSISDSFYGGSTDGSAFVFQASSSGVHISILESLATVGTYNANLGNGFFMRNGESLIQYCGSQGTFNATIIGYLVPASLVPAAGQAGSEAQSVRSNSTNVHR